jgi:ABC-2 type transport system ATP-binding protein
MFDEMETTCDRVAFLKNGRVIHVVDMRTILGNEAMKEYKIEFNSESDYREFIGLPFDITRRQEEYNQATIRIHDSKVSDLFAVLAAMDVRFISHNPYTLEMCFKEIYNKTEVA